MRKQYSIAAARDRLPALVLDVERGAPVELTRRGRPVAVLISVESYRRMAPPPGEFWDALERFRARADLACLDSEKAFAGTRDRAPGRAAAW
ncbi:MAG: type II toxin-antitoxin system prevent-host-death family antitoxin [Planctomycetes bacterium]|nr:type II toxin-antitoxin system prevent-host-death family antitoxin [Planctomycetota bacterium]